MKKGYIKVFSLDEYKYIWVDKNEAFQYYIDNILDFETVDEYLNMYDISNKYRVELVLKAFNDIMMNKLELSVIKQSKRGLLISDCYNDAEFQTWNTIIYNINNCTLQKFHNLPYRVKHYHYNDSHTPLSISFFISR